MKKNKWIYPAIIIFILSAISVCGFTFYSFRAGQKKYSGSGAVHLRKTAEGFQLIRNGQSFYIKGASGDSHLKELAEAGANTIRFYDTLNLQQKLNEAQKYGLAAIIDIPVPRFSYYSYTYEKDNEVIRGRVKSLVKKYKDHPALLIWNLGNEVNYPKIYWKDFLRVDYGKKRFRRVFNQLIDIIREEDPNHPVSTSTWNVDFRQLAAIYLYAPHIDIISYNIFGDTKNFLADMNRWKGIFGERPFYVAEFGPDGWWYSESKNTAWNTPIEQTSRKKAEQIGKRYNLINTNNKNCLGSLLFYWGNKFECTNTWFSMFKDSLKSEILMEMQFLWGKSITQPAFFGPEYMLIEGKGAFDNLIFTPGEIKTSELVFNNEFNKDSLLVEWEIIPDVWFHGWNEEKYNLGILQPPAPVDCFFESGNHHASFISPKNEGPYRIIAYVYDRNGYFGTANTPFYVLNPE